MRLKRTMKAGIHAFAVVLASGSVSGMVQGAPDPAPRGTRPSQHVGHIYYNIASGEKIVTLPDGTRPSDNGGTSEVWVADNRLPCSKFGQTSWDSGVVDWPCPSQPQSNCVGSIYLDWGDIETDQVVDCVDITWSTDIRDVDLDGDGFGDGVPGFGANWAWFDRENGFDSSATRLDLTGFTLFNLPGLTGSFQSPGLAVYTATVDLAASLTSSLVFEIGDTDSIDGSGTGIFNPGAGADLDGNGYADFGYAMQYIQPGTQDVDGDGVIDGDPGAQNFTAWLLVTGSGDIGTDGAYIPETDPPGALGIEDAFDEFADVDNDGVLEPIGTFFYGGFACVGSIGNTPFAQFYMKLYGPRDVPHVDCGDLFPPGAPDGVLNFFDIAEYLSLFNDNNPGADYFPPGGDGVFNFFDLVQYLGLFNAGCP
ncbi:MAG: GC-type dockerin domain-anchored protein [Planctomycetota bacterium]